MVFNPAMSNSTPPPIPPGQFDPLPNPLQYAHGNFPPRWSPMPAIIAGAACGMLLTGASYIGCKFIPIFQDFKITLSPLGEFALSAARIIWLDYVWVILIPVLIAIPAAAVPFIPVPAQPESRQRIARTARYIAVLIFLTTLIVIVLSLFAPMFALIQSVSGPQKK
jgi:hypothetical protein